MALSTPPRLPQMMTCRVPHHFRLSSVFVGEVHDRQDHAHSGRKDAR